MPDIIINGAVGRIEARYLPAPNPRAPATIILHPHPLHGGTMNNRVVHMLHQVFSRRGFSTLRFNFRGVGRSQGAFDRGEGELGDAATVLDWLQTNASASGVWVAGFSFGAWIGMQLLMRRPEIERFVAVSPPANAHDFTFLAPCPSSGIVLHGTADTTVPEAEVAKLAKRLKQQRGQAVEYVLIDGADHFYGATLPALEREVAAYIDRVTTARAAEAAG